jgi:hypothetical protein
MNRTISVIFRAIPLLMGAVCLGYGVYVYTGGSDTSPYFLAGNVLIALTAICFALFTTAATIIRQLIGRYGPLWYWLLPLSGYRGLLQLACALLWYRRLHRLRQAQAA